ncbi:MAG TPA: hypothetical protein VK465_00365 [Fibrobacteria bacterium]|nr:hypothetical protein [Fibrobacteria bacterium]
MKFAGSLVLATATAVFADGGIPKFHGAAWMQFGRIEHSYSIAGSPNNYDENWLGNYGGLVATSLPIDDNWEGGLGFGSILVHLARGSTAEAGIWYPFWVGFLSEARLTYSVSGFQENGGLQLNLGSFGYNYNRDSKNLGVYLLKGYVYPGTLVSGYADLFAVPASRTGASLRYRRGGFTNDLLVNLETEEKPLYDVSIADVVDWRIHPSFEIGAGVNFYRVMAADKEATSPSKACGEFTQGPFRGGGPQRGGQDNPCFIVRKDSAGVPIDTILGSLSGVKLMGRFRIDPKPWFGSPESMGPDELVIYGEAAVLGLKNYDILYDDILRRIPVMVGLNLPTMKLLNLSVEVEYYASKNSSDNLPPQSGSWLPALQDNPGTSRDDWKWSVNASKVVLGNFFLGLQVANDHLRLGGTHNTATGQEAMRTPKDWYWAFKTAYFF